MRTWLILYGQYMLNVLILRLAEAERMQPSGGEGEEKKFPVWAIILIVGAVVLCTILICVVVVLALLGPAIGEVLSNVAE